MEKKRYITNNESKYFLDCVADIGKSLISSIEVNDEDEVEILPNPCKNDIKVEELGEKSRQLGNVYPYIDKMHSMTIFFVIDRSQ